jgi:hypothetical protein
MVARHWHTDRVPLEILVVGPLLALAVLALIAVAADVTALRPSQGPGPGPIRDGDEFGLLRTVALTSDVVMANAVRNRLVSLGIRATIGTDRAGMVRVLVFSDEYEKARDAV